MRILLVDDEPHVLKTLTMSLEALGYDVTPCASPLDALDRSRQPENRFDLGFIDLRMYPIDGIDLMKRLHLLQPDITIVIITAHGTIDTAVDAVKKGAYDYLQKPFDLAKLREFVERVSQYHLQKPKTVEPGSGAVGAGTEADIVTRDPRMFELIALAERIAMTPLTVLIEGESGTGKELFASLIHRRSQRAGGPYVKVNCAALPESLLESELFGHVKGAFTGAHQDREGRFELANDGTIFLDEIGEMDLGIQAKLLRVLQSGEFERLGESTTRTTDVRVVAATNRSLEEEIAHQRFREDLFYRLNAVRIAIPPLRDRPSDIPALISLFLDQIVRQGGPRRVISNRALNALLQNRWRGNVRELENVIKRAAYLAQSEEIELDDLPQEYRLNDVGGIPLSLEDVEREHIRRVLAESESYEEAARKLAIDPATLWRKRKKYDL